MTDCFVITRVYELHIAIDADDRSLRVPGETDEELAFSIANAVPVNDWQLVGGGIEVEDR